jgi:hypothetical protein
MHAGVHGCVRGQTREANFAARLAASVEPTGLGSLPPFLNRGDAPLPEPEHRPFQPADYLAFSIRQTNAHHWLLLTWLRTLKNCLAVLCRNTYKARWALKQLHTPGHLRKGIQPSGEEQETMWHNGWLGLHTLFVAHHESARLIVIDLELARGILQAQTEEYPSDMDADQ